MKILQLILASRSALLLLLLILTPFWSFAMPATAQQTNYDEALVPEYVLPSLLGDIGDAEVTVDQWRQRRSELLRLFEEHVYGTALPRPSQIRLESRVLNVSEGGDPDLVAELEEVEREVRSGIAGCERRQLRIRFRRGDRTHSMDVLLYLPLERSGPVPVFLGLNFYGNAAIHQDPKIWLPGSWVQQRDGKGVVNNRATEKSRGVQASRWPLELLLRRGYGLATVYYGDIDPDFDDQFNNGVHSLFAGDLNVAETSSISAWAWGLSRALDFLQHEDGVDGQRVFVLGHSRLGKTALWAGACDERFAMVVSNNSGCGGAALSRRRFGETVQVINERFPHWFCRKFSDYNNREDDCPVDQHMLIALAAPRPVIVASASKDRWADPRGEFLAACQASPAYEVYGKEGLDASQLPPVNRSVGTWIGYHLRDGGHDLKEFDWQQFLDRADRYTAADE